MKTERITFLASPDFKQYLAAQALSGGTSVGELIRTRCMARTRSADTGSQERELSALTAELRSSIAQARASLQEGLQAASEAMNTIRGAQGRLA